MSTRSLIKKVQQAFIASEVPTGQKVALILPYSVPQFRKKRKKELDADYANEYSTFIEKPLPNEYGLAELQMFITSAFGKEFAITLNSALHRKRMTMTQSPSDLQLYEFDIRQYPNIALVMVPMFENVFTRYSFIGGIPAKNTKSVQVLKKEMPRVLPSIQNKLGIKVYKIREGRQFIFPSEAYPSLLQAILIPIIRNAYVTRSGGKDIIKVFTNQLKQRLFITQRAYIGEDATSRKMSTKQYQMYFESKPPRNVLASISVNPFADSSNKTIVISLTNSLDVSDGVSLTEDVMDYLVDGSYYYTYSYMQYDDSVAMIANEINQVVWAKKGVGAFSKDASVRNKIVQDAAISIYSTQDVPWFEAIGKAPRSSALTLDGAMLYEGTYKTDGREYFISKPSFQKKKLPTTSKDSENVNFAVISMPITFQGVEGQTYLFDNEGQILSCVMVMTSFGGRNYWQLHVPEEKIQEARPTLLENTQSYQDLYTEILNLALSLYGSSNKQVYVPLSDIQLATYPDILMRLFRAYKKQKGIILYKMQEVDNAEELVGEEQGASTTFGGKPIISTETVPKLGLVYDTGMREGGIFSLSAPISVSLLKMLVGEDVEDLTKELLALRQQFNLFPSKRGDDLTIFYPVQRTTPGADQTDIRAPLTQAALVNAFPSFQPSAALEHGYRNSIIQSFLFQKSMDDLRQNIYTKPLIEPRIINGRRVSLEIAQTKNTSNQESTTSLQASYKQLLEGANQGILVIDTLDASMTRGYFIDQMQEEVTRYAENLKALANNGYKIILTGCGPYAASDGGIGGRKLLLFSKEKYYLYSTPVFGEPSRELQVGVEKVRKREDSTYRSGRVFSDIRKVTATNKTDRLEQTAVVSACVVIGTFSPIVLNIGTFATTPTGDKPLSPTLDDLKKANVILPDSETSFESWENQGKGTSLYRNIIKAFSVEQLREWALDLIGDEGKMQNLGFRAAPRLSNYKAEALKQVGEELSVSDISKDIETIKERNRLVDKAEKLIGSSVLRNTRFSVISYNKNAAGDDLPTTHRDLFGQNDFVEAFDSFSSAMSRFSSILESLIDTGMSTLRASEYEEYILELIKKTYQVVYTKWIKKFKKLTDKKFNEDVLIEHYVNAADSDPIMGAYFEYIMQVDLLRTFQTLTQEEFTEYRRNNLTNVFIIGDTKYSEDEEERILDGIETYLESSGVELDNATFYVFDTKGTGAIVYNWANMNGLKVKILPSFIEGTNWRSERAKFIKDIVQPDYVVSVYPNYTQASDADKQITNQLTKSANKILSVSRVKGKFGQPITRNDAESLGARNLPRPSLKIYAITADLQGIKVGASRSPKSNKFNNTFLSFADLNDPYDKYWAEVCAACLIDSDTLSLSSMASKIPKAFKAPRGYKRMAGQKGGDLEKRFRLDWSRAIGGDLGNTLRVSVQGDKSQKRIASERLQSQFGAYNTKNGAGGRQRPVTLMDEARKKALRARLDPFNAYQDSADFYAWMVPIDRGGKTEYIKLDDYQSLKAKQLKKDTKFQGKQASMMASTEVNYRSFQPVLKLEGDEGQEDTFISGSGILIKDILINLENAAEERRRERDLRMAMIEDGSIDAEQYELARMFAYTRATEIMNNIIEGNKDYVAQVLSKVVQPYLLADLTESKPSSRELIQSFAPIFNVGFPNLKRFLSFDRLTAATYFFQYMSYLSGLMIQFVSEGDESKYPYIVPSRLTGKDRRRFERVYRGEVGTSMYYQSAVLHALLGYALGEIKPEAINFLHTNQSQLLQSGVEPEILQKYDKDIKDIKLLNLQARWSQEDFQSNVLKVQALLRGIQSAGSNIQMADVFKEYSTPYVKYLTGAYVDTYQEKLRLALQRSQNQKTTEVKMLEQLAQKQSQLGLTTLPPELNMARTYFPNKLNKDVKKKILEVLQPYVDDLQKPYQSSTTMEDIRSKLAKVEKSARTTLQRYSTLDIKEYIREKNPIVFQDLVLGSYENEALMGLIRGAKMQMPDGNIEWVIEPYRMIDYALTVFLRVYKEVSGDTSIKIKLPKVKSLGNLDGNKLKSIFASVQLKQNPLYKYLSNY